MTRALNPLAKKLRVRRPHPIRRLLAAVADWLADRWDPAFELDGLTEEDE